MQTWYGPVGGGVGAPCVTWVLDEHDVVGDNNRDLGVPRERRARSRQCYKAVQPELAGTRVAGADRGGRPVMLNGRPVTVVTSDDQVGIA